MTYCLIKDKNNLADSTGYGCVSYNFLIQQYFISCEDYASFLNSIGHMYKDYNLYNDKLTRLISKNRSIFTVNPNIDPKSPIAYIGIQQLKIYCNWQNTKNLQYLFRFPYDIAENKSYLSEATMWIPSYNEWYKAVYYDSALANYWLFTNRSNDPNSAQALSPYGLFNAGKEYYTIIDNSEDLYTTSDKYIIAGGCKHRNSINAKSGTVYYVSKEYYANYISARLCKKSETKKFVLKLYDTYGDGWGNNYIDINNGSHKPLYTKLTLKHGYGPFVYMIEVDKMERNINIRYHKQDNLAYENYYEFYDFDTNQLIYHSNQYEVPQNNIIISLG